MTPEVILDAPNYLPEEGDFFDVDLYAREEGPEHHEPIVSLYQITRETLAGIVSALSTPGVKWVGVRTSTEELVTVRTKDLGALVATAVEAPAVDEVDEVDEVEPEPKKSVDPLDFNGEPLAVGDRVILPEWGTTGTVTHVRPGIPLVGIKPMVQVRTSMGTLLSYLPDALRRVS